MNKKQNITLNTSSGITARTLYCSSCIFFLFILLFSGTAGADSMLWEVKSPTATVYLLGSIHLAKPELYPLAPVIEDSFDKSQNLVLEVNVLKVDQAQLVQRIMAEGMYSGEKSIKDDLSSETYAMLEEHLKKTGLPTVSFLKMKPALLALTLESLEYIQLGFSPDNGIDMYFARKAGNAKPILELESIEEQTDLIVNMPDANLFLKYTIMDLSRVGKQLDRITELWKSGNADAMNTLLIEDSLKEYPELASVMDEMIFKRNRKMAGKIKEYLSTDQTYFVIVGTAHLIGDRSIVEFIEEAGYAVQKH